MNMQLSFVKLFQVPMMASILTLFCLTTICMTAIYQTWSKQGSGLLKQNDSANSFVIDGIKQSGKINETLLDNNSVIQLIKNTDAEGATRIFLENDENKLYTMNKLKGKISSESIVDPTAPGDKVKGTHYWYNDLQPNSRDAIGRKVKNPMFSKIATYDNLAVNEDRDEESFSKMKTEVDNGKVVPLEMPPTVQGNHDYNEGYKEGKNYMKPDRYRDYLPYYAKLTNTNRNHNYGNIYVQPEYVSPNRYNTMSAKFYNKPKYDYLNYFKAHNYTKQHLRPYRDLKFVHDNDDEMLQKLLNYDVDKYNGRIKMTNGRERDLTLSEKLFLISNLKFRKSDPSTTKSLDNDTIYKLYNTRSWYNNQNNHPVVVKSDENIIASLEKMLYKPIRKEYFNGNSYPKISGYISPEQETFNNRFAGLNDPMDYDYYFQNNVMPELPFAGGPYYTGSQLGYYVDDGFYGSTPNYRTRRANNQDAIVVVYQDDYQDWFVKLRASIRKILYSYDRVCYLMDVMDQLTTIEIGKLNIEESSLIIVQEQLDYIKYEVNAVQNSITFQMMNKNRQEPKTSYSKKPEKKNDFGDSISPVHIAFQFRRTIEEGLFKTIKRDLEKFDELPVVERGGLITIYKQFHAIVHTLKLLVHQLDLKINEDTTFAIKVLLGLEKPPAIYDFDEIDYVIENDCANGLCIACDANDYYGQVEMFLTMNECLGNKIDHEKNVYNTYQLKDQFDYKSFVKSVKGFASPGFMFYHNDDVDQYNANSEFYDGGMSNFIPKSVSKDRAVKPRKPFRHEDVSNFIPQSIPKDRVAMKPSKTFRYEDESNLIPQSIPKDTVVKPPKAFRHNSILINPKQPKHTTSTYDAKYLWKEVYAKLKVTPQTTMTANKASKNPKLKNHAVGAENKKVKNTYHYGKYSSNYDGRKGLKQDVGYESDFDEIMQLLSEDYDCPSCQDMKGKISNSDLHPSINFNIYKTTFIHDCEEKTVPHLSNDDGTTKRLFPNHFTNEKLNEYMTQESMQPSEETHKIKKRDVGLIQDVKKENDESKIALGANETQEGMREEILTFSENGYKINATSKIIRVPGTFVSHAKKAYGSALPSEKIPKNSKKNLDPIDHTAFTNLYKKLMEKYNQFAKGETLSGDKKHKTMKGNKDKEGKKYYSPNFVKGLKFMDNDLLAGSSTSTTTFKDRDQKDREIITTFKRIDHPHKSNAKKTNDINTTTEKGAKGFNFPIGDNTVATYQKVEEEFYYKLPPGFKLNQLFQLLKKSEYDGKNAKGYNASMKEQDQGTFGKKTDKIDLKKFDPMERSTTIILKQNKGKGDESKEGFFARDPLEQKPGHDGLYESYKPIGRSKTLVYKMLDATSPTLEKVDYEDNSGKENQYYIDANKLDNIETNIIPEYGTFHLEKDFTKKFDPIDRSGILFFKKLDPIDQSGIMTFKKSDRDEGVEVKKKLDPIDQSGIMAFKKSGRGEGVEVTKKLDPIDQSGIMAFKKSGRGEGIEVTKKLDPIDQSGIMTFKKSDQGDGVEVAKKLDPIDQSGIMTFKKSDQGDGVEVAKKLDPFDQSGIMTFKKSDQGDGVEVAKKLDPIDQSGISVFKKLDPIDQSGIIIFKKLDPIDIDGLSTFKKRDKK